MSESFGSPPKNRSESQAPNPEEEFEKDEHDVAGELYNEEAKRRKLREEGGDALEERVAALSTGRPNVKATLEQKSSSKDPEKGRALGHHSNNALQMIGQIIQALESPILRKRGAEFLKRMNELSLANEDDFQEPVLEEAPEDDVQESALEEAKRYNELVSEFNQALPEIKSADIGTAETRLKEFEARLKDFKK